MPESPAIASDEARTMIPRLLVRARALILSVDGPVCALTPQLSSLGAADRVRGLVEVAGHRVPAELTVVDDPLMVMRFAGSLGDVRLLCDIEDVLARLELLAMMKAHPTPGAHEVVRASRAAAKGVSMVGDQAAWTMERYLAIHALTDQVNAVGRWTVQPQRWMPDAHPLRCAAMLRSRPSGGSLHRFNRT
ncbi:hypothetical protein [Catellatospora sichuanensis]|uniref:hypothetical protein n=1 Tax=Catellatospora sichuanensis TaxID=1969805 RepID=UPI001642F653|nr:hypothetical protein [Catellatospora sichuanensis]